MDPPRWFFAFDDDDDDDDDEASSSSSSFSTSSWLVDSDEDDIIVVSSLLFIASSSSRLLLAAPVSSSSPPKRSNTETPLWSALDGEVGEAETMVIISKLRRSGACSMIDGGAACPQLTSLLFSPLSPGIFFRQLQSSHKRTMMYVVFFALLASLTHIVVAARRFTSTIIYGGRGLYE